MNDWAPKRFWTEANVVERGGGFSVDLDGRAVKTPDKAAADCADPCHGARRSPRSGRHRTGKIDPTTMPATRAANSAIDKVAPQHADVVALLAAYGENDLLCYRAGCAG